MTDHAFCPEICRLSLSADVFVQAVAAAQAGGGSSARPGPAPCCLLGPSAWRSSARERSGTATAGHRADRGGMALAAVKPFRASITA